MAVVSTIAIAATEGAVVITIIVGTVVFVIIMGTSAGHCGHWSSSSLGGLLHFLASGMGSW